MPDKRTIERSRHDQREGKAPSTKDPTARAEAAKKAARTRKATR